MTTYILRNDDNAIVYVTDNCAKAWVRRGENHTWTIEAKDGMRRTLRTEMMRAYP